MKTRTLLIAWTFAAMLSTFVSNAAEQPADEAKDPIVTSFEREFNHEAPQPKTINGKDVEDDVLYERINKPLQSSASAKAGKEEDQS